MERFEILQEHNGALTPIPNDTQFPVIMTGHRISKSGKTLSLTVESIVPMMNLLARIHRDGGHYVQEHGLKKAIEDAEQAVITNFQNIEAYKGHECPRPIVAFMQGDFYIPNKLALNMDNVKLKGVLVNNMHVIIKIEIQEKLKEVPYKQIDAYSRVKV